MGQRTYISQNAKDDKDYPTNDLSQEHKVGDGSCHDDHYAMRHRRDPSRDIDLKEADAGALFGQATEEVATNQIW
eukprot:2088145-Amphidinium_carterae.1